MTQEWKHTGQWFPNARSLVLPTTIHYIHKNKWRALRSFPGCLMKLLATTSCSCLKQEREREIKNWQMKIQLSVHINDSKWGSLKSIIFPICSTLKQYLEFCSQNISIPFYKVLTNSRERKIYVILIWSIVTAYAINIETHFVSFSDKRVSFVINYSVHILNNYQHYGNQITIMLYMIASF